MNNPIVELTNVTRAYRLGPHRIEVLRGVNWQVERGKWVCLLGASGSGKTTLLNLLGGLERPDSGTLRVAGVDLATLSRRAAAHFRNQRIGFVFQAYHLLPEFSILENVTLPARFGGLSRRETVAKAEALLESMGLKDRLKHRPTELSGGEQQRAAIARALINDPELLLADEPTGNLDSHTGAKLLDLFHQLHADHPTRSIVMITHNREVADLADHSVELVDGKLKTE